MTNILRSVALMTCVLLTAHAIPSSAQRLVGFDLALVDLDGAKKVLGRLPPSVFAPRLSPDGKRIAIETRDRSGPDGARLWIAELSDIGGRRPVAAPVGPQDWAPMWTINGDRLVFIVSNEKGDAIFWRRADGTGVAEHLLDARSAEGLDARRHRHAVSHVEGESGRSRLRHRAL